MAFLYKRFYSVFIVYLFLQPVIDVATSIDTRQTGGLLSVGTYLRFIFMLYCFGFILYELIKLAKTKKLPIIFFILSMFAIFMSFVVNFVTKHPFWLSTEVKFYAKSLYFIVFLYTVYFYIRNTKQPQHLVKYLAWINFIYGFFVIAPYVVGLSYDSYQYSKGGTVGLFYSANEVGAILSLLSPISLLYALRHGSQIKKIYSWLPFIFSVIAMYMLGTKVAMLTVVVIILLGFVLIVINAFKKNKMMARGSWIMFVIVGVVMFAVIPLSPTLNNTKIQANDPHLKTAQQLREAQLSENPTPDQQSIISINKKKVPKEVRINKHVHNKYLRLLLNNRDRFFFNRYHDFKHANILRKTFGLGYAGDYVSHPKIVEMDFLDAFISYGALGSILFLSPLLYFIVLALVYLFSNIRENNNLPVYQLVIAVIMGLGISFISGHIMYEPAAALYLAMLLPLLLAALKNKALN